MTISLDGYVAGPADAPENPMGRGGDHHDGVPIIVLTHHVPAEPPPGSVEYATDPRKAATRAREAVGGGGFAPDQRGTPPTWG